MSYYGNYMSSAGTQESVNGPSVTETHQHLEGGPLQVRPNMNGGEGNGGKGDHPVDGWRGKFPETKSVGRNSSP